MAQKSNLESRESEESVKKDSLEFKEEKDGAVESANVASSAVDALGGVDASSETMGHVSEVLRENGEVQGEAGVGGKGEADDTQNDDDFDPEMIKSRLLENVPKELVMRAEVKREIEKEIKYLHKKAMRMMRSPNEINYSEMNNILKKIRELKSVLNELVKSSIEGVKTLWLRFVHGIM